MILNNPLSKHIILLGFKSTGKSTVAKILATHLHKRFYDLDKKIETRFFTQYGIKLSCRNIFTHHGESFFRNCETQVLKEVLSYPPAIIALGGGAPLKIENQNMIGCHWLVHITAEPEVVFERIMRRGRPAYFPNDQDPWFFFKGLWEKHQKIYTRLTSFKLDNTGSIKQVVSAILKEWEKANEIHSH